MPEESVNDPVFGELAYDPPMEQWYTTVALTPGHEIAVSIWWGETDGPFDPVRQIAAQAFKLFQTTAKKHHEQLAAAMLERYRRGAGLEKRLPGAPEIAHRLRAHSISIAPDGSMIVHYDDGDEFCTFRDLVGLCGEVE